MNIRQITSALTKPRIIAPTVFMAVATGKTMLDYEKAKPEKKRRILAKDSAMLFGSLAGFMLMNPLTRRLCKNPNINKSVINSTQYILTQTVSAVLNTLAGITGAVCANELVHKYVLNRPAFTPDVKPENKTNTPASSGAPLFVQSNVFKNFNYVNQSAQYTAGALLSLPSVSNFTTAPLIALTGMSVANTNGYNNKIKRTAKELIANSLIPTVLVSTVSLMVNNKKGVIKYPALLGALATGSFAGNMLAKRYQEKLYETIDSIDFQNINFKRAFKARSKSEKTNISYSQQPQELCGKCAGGTFDIETLPPAPLMAGTEATGGMFYERG